jgi:ABC-type amino acid transport substrate-binding protein
VNIYKIITALLLLGLVIWGAGSGQPNSVRGDVVVIGTELEFPPFAYLQDESIIGFDIDVVKEACKRAGLACQIKPVPHFGALIPELIMEKIDVVAAGMTPTRERAQKVLFTQPHYEGRAFVVITREGMESITSLEDLSGYTVSVNEGYIHEAALEEVSGVTLLRLGTPTEALLALKVGHVDAFLTAAAVAEPLLKANVAAGYSVFTIDGTEEKVAFALNKKRTELAEKLNEAIESMKSDGTLMEMEGKWGLR